MLSCYEISSQRVGKRLAKRTKAQILLWIFFSKGMKMKTHFGNDNYILLSLFQLFIYKKWRFKLEIFRHFRNDDSNQIVLRLMSTAPQTPPLPSPPGELGAERKLIYFAQA